MRHRIRKHLPTIAVAMATAAVTAAAPAIAHGVEHALFAHDSAAVDGKSAVGSAADREERAGKLVAADARGKFPGGAIPVGADEELTSVGPLPQEVEIRSDGGDYLMMVAGSGYRPGSSRVSGHIGMWVTVTDSSLSRVFSVETYTNELSSHKAFVPIFRTISPKKGPFTIKLEPMTSSFCGTVNEQTFHFCTATDGNDLFNVTLIDLP